MKNALFHRVIAYLNLAGLAIMIVDSYWVSAPVLKIVDHDVVRTEYTYKYGTTDYLYIFSTSGDRFKVPADTLVTLQQGDTFYVQKSGLFHKQLSLRYPRSGKSMEVCDTGVLRRNVFGEIAAVFVFGLSIINVGARRIIADESMNERLIIGALVGMLILTAFYIFL